MIRLRRRQWIFIGGAAALVLLVAIAIGRRESSRSGGGSQSGRDAMADMPGMPATSTSSGSGIQLTTSQIRKFGVTFGAVERRTLVNELRVPGTVTPDETRLAQVAMRFGGFVERLHVNFTGQYVRRGQPLLDIYSPEVFAATQELLVAVRLQKTGSAPVPGLPTAGSDLVGATRRRLELLEIPAGQIEEVLRDGKPLRTVRVFSPVAGVVTDRLVVQGQSVQAGQTLYAIADLSSVWVTADVPEADVALLRPGAGADVELASLPGRPFKGVVTYVNPTLKPETRTVTARVTVANASGQLKPGMFATVRLASRSRVALSVPTSAVVRTGERTLVFVDLGSGRIQPQPIETGRTTDDYTEVLSGLEPGQRVVTSAQFLLDSESNLAEVMRSMMGQAGAADMSKMPGMEMRGGMNDKGARVRP